MNTTKWLLLAGMASASVTLLWACGSTGDSTPQTSGSLLNRTSVVQYRRWLRVNPQPIQMQQAFAASCAISPTSLSPDPHADKYATVYVNDIGRAAMLTQKTPVFPTGSVIVKEKSLTPDAAKVELLTIMVKRGAGYDPDNGDWEYAVTDGSVTQVQGDGKLQNCQTCHAYLKSQDYVFRAEYLPASVNQQLK